MQPPNSPYYSLSYNEKESLVLFTGHLPSEDQSEEDFKEASIKYTEFIEYHEPDFFLSDLRSYRYVVTPALQNWAVQNSSSRIMKTPVKKLAIVVSEAFITQLSVEQHADEAQKQRSEEEGKPLRYFTSIEEAKQWFLDEPEPAAEKA